MSVKMGIQELQMCCICLATNTSLYNIKEAQLQDIFLRLIDTEECGGLGSVCGVCRAELRRVVSLRTRARRAQALMAAALRSSYIPIDYIQTIDRVAEKLCLNLKTCHVYSSDSTLPDIKLEHVKEEIDDFTEHIFTEPVVDEFDSNYPVSPEYMNSLQDSAKEKQADKLVKKETNGKPAQYRKSKAKKLSSESDRSTKEATKAVSNAKKKQEPKSKGNPNEKTKRVIKRRMADNGFLPDFNFEEFQNKYNVKIDILSKEEQLREIETRKMSASYSLAAYGCEECGKGFATKQVYDAHMMKHDASAGAHACNICGIRFRTRSRAHVHADAHRLRFTCACGFLTRTRFIAKNHFLSHAGSKHQCPHCDAVFSKYTSYLTHVRRRHPAMNVACDECGETFVGHNGLRHHKTRVHRNGLTANKTQHVCEVCSANFASEAALSAHARSAPSEHDASLKPCPVCGESRDGAARHEETCAAPRTRLCRECNKWFVCGAYDTHYERVHLNVRAREPPRARSRPQRPFICERCGTECSSVSSLAAHARAHAGLRPHACPAPACTRRFATLHNMRRHHQVVHLGQRPQVACGVCGKLLAHAASLKLHVNTVHLKLPAPPRRRRQEEVK